MALPARVGHNSGFGSVEKIVPTQEHLLATLRKTRRLSQLQLALAAEVSARHISFIETGRSQPSQTLLMQLAEAMGLPHRETNALLSTCGYRPLYSNLPLEEAAMRPVQEALAIMLDNHEPFPATVLNRHWDLHLGNQSMQHLLTRLLGPALPEPPVNLLQLTFCHRGLRPFIVNWDELAGLLLRRLKLEQYSRPCAGTAALLDTLLQMDPPDHWQVPPSQWEGPTLTVQVRVGEQVLNLFTTLTSFGTPMDADLQDLLIESYFPADDATRQFFNQPPFAPSTPPRAPTEKPVRLS